MLTLYEKGTCDKMMGKEPITELDDYFDSHIDQIQLDDIIQGIAGYIDGARFIGGEQTDSTDPLLSDCKLKNRFGDITDVINLSTGAKGVICVYAFPKLIFDLQECGNNAITYVFTLPRGRMTTWIYEREEAVGFPAEDKDVKNKVRVITWYGTRICESVYEVYHYFTWCDYYGSFAWSSRNNYFLFCGIRHAVTCTKIADFDDFVEAAIDRYVPFAEPDIRYDMVQYPGYSCALAFKEGWENDVDFEADMKARLKKMGNNDPVDEWILRKRYARETFRREKVKWGWKKIPKDKLPKWKVEGHKYLAPSRHTKKKGKKAKGKGNQQHKTRGRV